MFSSRVSFAFALLCVVGALSSPASAQVGMAELRGTILDESGGALPGATVTAVHVETGTTRTVVTSQTGTYLMPALPIGAYRVTFELGGFATFVHEGLRLGVGESVTVNAAMKVAALEESVTVVGESPLVETTKSDLAGRVQQSQIEALPLSGRNWLELVSLVPGARGNPGQIGAGAAGGDAARYQMDGISVTGQGTGGETQSYSHETVAEFQVLTNRFDAEYGRVTGAVVNAVSKSGTNEVRGSALFFVRNDRFDAKNFFTNRVSPFDEKQSGFTIGGPIVKDRAHFFAAYEYQKRSITARPDTRLPQFDVDVDASIKRNLPSVRTDIQINNSHRLFVRTSMYYQNAENNGVGGRTTVSAGNNQNYDNLDVSIGETWVISGRAVHELRAGVFYFYKQLTESAAMPRLSFPSAILGPASNVPQWWKERIFQVSDSLSYFVPDWHGEHKFKMGFQYVLPYYQGELPKISYGQYNFARDPVDFDDPTTYPPPTSYSVTLGDFHYNVNNPVYAGFIQDDWTVSPKLTFNLGLRYDVEPKVTNKDLTDPLDQGDRRVDKDNIAPRFGFAYDLAGDGRTVVRGGAGRYYGNILLNIPMNEARDRNDRVSVNIISPVYGDPLQGRTIEDFQALGLPRSRTLLAIDYETPLQDQISLGLAQTYGGRFSWQVDYVHAVGRHLQMSNSINFFEDPVRHVPLSPVTHGRPYPEFLDITRYESWGRSRYDGLQTGFTLRRGPAWYEVQGSYTLSWAKGHTPSNRFGTVNNPFNPDDEYSYLTTDQRHRIIVNGSVHLPWGMNVSSIFFFGSKRPLNITTNRDPLRIGRTGRWLDATGAVLPKNGERELKNDYKLDLRVMKAFRFGRTTIQGVVDVFNVLNTENWGSYGTTFGTATYLQPGSTTNLFYQPRQVQFGIRTTF